MTKVVIISAIALAIVLAGSAVVYAQTDEGTPLRQMPMWGGDTGAGTTNSFDEMVDICLTAGGMSPEQAQEHMQNMDEHMGDGTWQQHMADGTCQEHMADGTYQEHMADGTWQDHMGGSSEEMQQHMEEHMGGSTWEEHHGSGHMSGHMGI